MIPGRRSLLKLLGFGWLLPVAAPAADVVPNSPQERTFGGLKRAITISIPADPTPYWPKMIIEDSFGSTIELVTSLELTLNAADMLFHGHITRIAQDRVLWDDRGLALGFTQDGELKYVREPVVVTRFEVLPPSDPRS
jgi:hypothetical protein